MSMASKHKQKMESKAAMFDELVTRCPDTISALLSTFKSQGEITAITPTLARPKSDTTNSGASTNVFRFQDLPAELRNRIYELALTVDHPICLARHTDKLTYEAAMKEHKKRLKGRRHTRGLHAPKMSYCLKTAPVKTIGSTKRSFSLHDLRTLHLLYVSRAVRDEARPILYSRNKFTFETGGALAFFIQSTGDAVLLLTDIAIKKFTPNEDKRILPYLHLAVKIQHLTIQLKPWCTLLTLNRTATDLVLAFCPPSPMRDHLSTCKCWNGHDVCTCLGLEQRNRLVEALSIEDSESALLPRDDPQRENLKAEVMKGWQAYVQTYLNTGPYGRVYGES